MEEGSVSNFIHIMMYVVPFLTIFIFIYVFAFILSPKFRGKMMSKQVKSMKYMVDESKDDIQSISTNMADATSSGIETTVRSIRKGFSENESIYCKHCGSVIDKDSKFCKHCGKEQ